MERMWVQGIVTNGQVVLETPLALPDGTVVAVTDYEPDDDPRPEGHDRTPNLARAREALLAMIGRSELLNDPNWEQKLRCQHES